VGKAELEFIVTAPLIVTTSAEGVALVSVEGAAESVLAVVGAGVAEAGFEVRMRGGV
jgi:hypothetical protein